MNQVRGLTVSVGDTLADSKNCTWITNTGETSTSSTTGLSAWLTCNNFVGSKLFVTNRNLSWVLFFEVMAFTQYNVLPFVYSVFGANPVTNSAWNNLNRTEMNIQTGTATTCFTSVAEASVSACTGTMNDPCYPYVWFIFEAVIPFSAFLAIPQISPDSKVTTSFEYSTSLKIEVYKKLSPSFGIAAPDSAYFLVGECDPIADPLLNPESDCYNF